MDNYLLEMKEINKEFPGVRALDHVSFSVIKGEIHGLVGENGAGKTTLVKVLSGAYGYGSYSGGLFFKGVEQKFLSPRDSVRAGISIIYQDLDLIMQMSIAENIFLGTKIASNGIINWNSVYSEAERLMKDVGLDANPSTKVMYLTPGQQKLVEITRALSRNTELLILDEPAASLTASETKGLFDILTKLKEKGVTSIYISRRLKEIFEITERITVLRDGRTILTDNKSAFTENKLISLMVGRSMNRMFPRKDHRAGETVMMVRNWTVTRPDNNENCCDNLNFNVRKGEILGIFGMMGSGRTELALSIMGKGSNIRTGELYINGKKVNISRSGDALKNGVAMLSEDRKNFDLIENMNIAENISLAALNSVSFLGVINKKKEIKAAGDFVKELRIRTPNLEVPVRNLSGGNQQKVILSKLLMTKPKILILDEPTHGVDVGAKSDIYNIMNMLIDEGIAIIMISSELPEILGICDRILVMSDGRITGGFDYREASQEKLMQAAESGKK